MGNVILFKFSIQKLVNSTAVLGFYCKIYKFYPELRVIFEDKKKF